MHMNLPVNTVVRQVHPRSRDSQGQETFLAPSADNQTCNYEQSTQINHPLLSTLKSKELNRSKIK